MLKAVTSPSCSQSPKGRLRSLDSRTACLEIETDPLLSFRLFCSSWPYGSMIFLSISDPSLSITR